MVSQITSIVIAYPTISSNAHKKHKNSAPLAFVRGIHRWPVIPPQSSSDAENVSILWGHQVVQPEEPFFYWSLLLTNFQRYYWLYMKPYFDIICHEDESLQTSPFSITTIAWLAQHIGVQLKTSTFPVGWSGSSSSASSLAHGTRLHHAKISLTWATDVCAWILVWPVSHRIYESKSSNHMCYSDARNNPTRSHLCTNNRDSWSPLY